jgi:LPPG:FO 2-phospho-L-lactate transferase
VPDVEVRAIPLLMSDVDATAAMVQVAFSLAGVSSE